MSKLEYIKTNGYAVEIGNTYPLGIEATTQCIRNIGQYILDNAEKIGEEAMGNGCPH